MFFPKLSRRDFLLLTLALASKTSPNRIVESRVRVMKLIFLAQKEAGDTVKKIVGMEEPYKFEPYLHGPFSKQVLDDLDSLQREGLIEIKVEIIELFVKVYKYKLTEEGEAKVAEILRNIRSTASTEEALKRLEKVVSRYATKPLRELLKYVYRTYPEESTPSTIEKILATSYRI